MNLLLICSYGLIFIFIFAYLILFCQSKKAGKVGTQRTYSYKSLLYHFAKDILVFFAIIGTIYIVSRDIEVTIGLGAFLLACFFANFLRFLLFQYQGKRAGGEEKSWEERE